MTKSLIRREQSRPAVPPWLALWSRVDAVCSRHFHQRAYTLSDAGNRVYVQTCNVGWMRQALREAGLADEVTVVGLERA